MTFALCSDFFEIGSANYGNCYTFNSNQSDVDTLGGKRKSTLPGPNMGLTIVINLEQSEYMKNGLTSSAGARFAYILYAFITAFIIQGNHTLSFN